MGTQQDNSKGWVEGQMPAAEVRQGPDTPQPSHHQVKGLNNILREYAWAISRIQPSGIEIGRPMGRITYDMQRAAEESAARDILRLFNFGA